MRLYYYPTSANSRRVLLTAILLEARARSRHRGSSGRESIEPRPISGSIRTARSRCLATADSIFGNHMRSCSTLRTWTPGRRSIPRTPSRAQTSVDGYSGARIISPRRSASSAGSGSRREWLAAWADPILLRSREARRCSRRRRRCSMDISLIGDGSPRTG